MTGRPMTRRQFLVWGTGAGGALVTLMLATPIVGFLLYPIFHRRTATWVTVGPIDDIPTGIPTPMKAAIPTGEGWPTPPQQRVVYVVKYDDGTAAFFANICTHMQCDVHWDPDLGQFLCPCHGGLYDLRGRNVGGPPPSPLPQWTHRVRTDAAGRQVLEIQNTLDESI